MTIQSLFQPGGGGAGGLKINITEVLNQTSKKVRSESGDSGLGEREQLDLSFGDTTPTDPPVSARSSPVPNEEEGGGGAGDQDRLSHSLVPEGAGGGGDQGRLSHSLVPEGAGGGGGQDRLSHSLGQGVFGNNEILLKLDEINKKLNSLQLGKSEINENKEDHRPQNPRTDLVDQITLAKNINDLVEAGFSYREEFNKIVCSLCKVSFSCPDPHVVDKQNKFYSLKSNVKNHLGTSRHLGKLEEKRREEEEETVTLSRNQKAGLNLGRIVYSLAKKG